MPSLRLQPSRDAPLLQGSYFNPTFRTELLILRIFDSIKPHVRVAKQSKQVLMLLCEIEHQGSLPRDQEHVNPHKILEDPPCRWVLHRLPLVVGKGGGVVPQRFANAILQRRIQQQAHGHHHQQCHDPLRLFERERGGQKAGVFQKAKAAFHQGLAFVACSQLLRWQLGVVECIGGEDETTLLIDEWLMGSDGGRESPFDSIDDLGREGALARSPPLVIARRRAQGNRLEERCLQPLRQAPAAPRPWRQ